MVDDEPAVLSAVSVRLAQLGWRSLVVTSASQALRAAKNPCLDVALVDYRLGDREDGIRLGRIMRRRWGVPFVLFSGYLNTQVVVAAMRSGAVDVIEKPVDEGRLKAALARWRVQSGLPVADSGSAEAGRLAVNELHPVTIRWARMILKACQASDDPRTVALWATTIGTSQSTIDEICRLCSVRAQDSRDVARFLRAIALSKSTATPLFTHLAVADERTLKNLFRRAGLPRNAREAQLHEFFKSQIFIPTSKLCLRELAHLAANSPSFF